MTQKMEEKFATFEIEYALRSENYYVDALATLESQIAFEGSSTRIEVNKRKESIIEMLKERFQEERCEEDWRIPIKEALTREEDMTELKVLKDRISERRIISQDARWSFFKMRGAGGNLKKVEEST